MKIVLTGTYNSANKGDAAMQQVFVTEILRRRAAAEVIIASPFPARDASYHAPTGVVRSHRRNLPLAILHWLLLESLRLVGREIHRYPFDQEIGSMVRADAIVDLSGDMLTEDYGPLVGFSHFLPLLQAQALGKPVIICAQSLGPFRHLASLAKRILRRASLITVREALSVSLLADLADKAITPALTADLAFLLPPADATRLQQMQAAEGIPPRGKRRLGVSVSALLLRQNNRHLRTGSGSSLAELADGLDRIVDRHGVELILVPHVFGPTPAADDRTAAAQLAGRMRHRPYSLRAEYRPEELKALIATCDCFVGCRMHANIAALDSGVPVLAIGYSHKTRGILERFELGDRVLPIEDLTAGRLLAEVERLLDGATQYRDHLNARLPSVRAAAARNIDLVLAAIESAPQRRGPVTGSDGASQSSPHDRRP